MGSTICYDTLLPQAKAKSKTLRSKTDPPEIDQELVEAVKKEKENYEKQAQGIYDAQTKKIKAKYDALTKAVDAQKPVWIAEFTKERFNSEDVEKYSKDGIKATFQGEVEKLMINFEDYQKKLDEERLAIEDKAVEKGEETLKKTANEATEKAKDRVKSKREKRKEQREKEKELKLDLIGAASEIGKGEDKNIDDFENVQREAYDQYKEHVMEMCKFTGEKNGAKLVQEYNTIVIDNAKSFFENTKDTLAKMEVKLNQSKQTAVLQLAAMLGL